MIREVRKIKSNKIKCNKCGDIIESFHVDDFKWCSCGTVAVDGGKSYLRRLGYPEYEELSNYIQLIEITTDGFEIVENALSKKDLKLDNINCHICSSSNISLEKGSGELIIGDDSIGLVCHECEKIYKFNDVKYRTI